MRAPTQASTERLDHYEVLRETGALIDSLTDSERRQVMVSLAERYGLRVSDKTATPPRGYAPGFRRKRVHA